MLHSIFKRIARVYALFQGEELRLKEKLSHSPPPTNLVLSIAGFTPWALRLVPKIMELHCTGFNLFKPFLSIFSFTKYGINQTAKHRAIPGITHRNAVLKN